LSPFYKNLIEGDDKQEGQTKEYLQGKLRAAIWLIRSIHQRQRTIFKVTESIVKQQKDFFDKGISFLRPMVLRDVANDIGMHESTVSRVTTNKYVHTPRGIFELKYFFNSGISRVSGSDVASETVKEKVKQIISQESPNSPISDQKIVELLLKENINIARRTVAKYRDMLGILPSSKRKKIF
jgi:RNA polymerase sigma-54 factor